MATGKTKKNSGKEVGKSAVKKAGRVKTTPGKIFGQTKSKASAAKKTLSGKTSSTKKVVHAKMKPVAGRKKTAEKRVSGKAPVKRKQKNVALATKRSMRIPAAKSRSKELEEERRASLRKLLISRREQIVKEAKAEISKYIKGETRQLVDTALDDGDWSVVDLSEDVSLRRLSTHRENLQRIDEALRKFDEGTYGICEDCGEEISRERLKILPFAIYCTDCQEKREQLAEIERSGS